LKRYCRPPLAEQFRRIVESKPLRSSAWREFHFINKLRRLGVATAHPVAFGEEMLGRWEVRSFVVTAEIQGQALEKLLEQVSCGTRPAPSWTERREIIEQLAAMTRTLHAAGLFHRDLYFSHVFLTHNRDGGGVLRLIDLARMIERPWLPGRWRIKDLAALDYSAPADLVTHADRLRFLYHYLGWTTGARARVAGGGSPGRRGRRWKDHARDIIRAVRARASRMARHDAKRGRGRVKVGA
jgi:heptose I phosphotransferase